MLKHIIFCLILVLSSSAVLAQPENINVQQLQQLMDDDVVVIDVRTQKNGSKQG